MRHTSLALRLPGCLLMCALGLADSAALVGQAKSAEPALHNAPQPPIPLLALQAALSPAAAASGAFAVNADADDTGDRPRLTQADAEKMAIRNNPKVSVARLLALAQHQVVRETRSAELPTANAAVTAMQAEDASRLSAGSLTASRLFEHAGTGGGFTQLLTDFGKTSNLVAYAKLQEKAQRANALAATEDIVIATDQAFFNALQAQALLQVATQNTATRQTTESQISAYTQNKLKSTLDLSFADVNLSQAKVLELNAQSNADATMAALDAVLGLDHPVNYQLVDDATPLTPPPPDAGQLVQTALAQRPDLDALSLHQQAAVKFSHAQRDQMLPSIVAAGTVGSVPIRPAQYYVQNWWGGIGVTMNIPLFNGFLYSAETKEAAIRAEAASEQVRDLRDSVVRDVRTAWLAANNAYQSVALSKELLNQSNLALSLAQTRYKLGLSSIVELSQAQYQQTDAAIGFTNAQYQYRLALATLSYQTGATP